MSELEDRLNALLSNPEDMGKIARMASKLMGEISPPPSASPGADAGGGGEGLGALGGLGNLGNLGSLLSGGGPLLGAVSRIVGGLGGLGGGGGSSGNKNQLLAGMSPYLTEERRKRLGRALRIASAARLAGVALAEFGGENGL